ncbi:MAG: SGNH/GDSL hydrolase family protein [Oscillospiraceae bacterium]|nr:SGNH/GDSL hydrolase family protein [Oscillospiraceae bacterium]
MKKYRKTALVLKYTAAFLASALVFAGIQRLFMPKFMSDVFDGALIGEYYSQSSAASALNHDVIFLGDCEVYQNFSPPVLFREFGITSHVRGGPSQTMWQSYWLLRDTLLFADVPPKVVVLSVLSMRRGDELEGNNEFARADDAARREAYNRLNIDGMRMSEAKLGSAESSMQEGESLLSYVFPLLRYKDRWRELSHDDTRYFWEARNVGFNGYLVRSEVRPVLANPPPPRRPDSYEFPAITRDYLERIRRLCEENGIELILFKSPAPSPHWWNEWDEQIAEYAQGHALKYFSLVTQAEEIGIDWQLHTPNQGQNLNVAGAEILTRWFGEQISYLPDLRTNAAIVADWERLNAAYERHKAKQLRELAEFDEVRTNTWQ